MAAPTPAVRVTPSGIKMDDGYQTLITITADTNIDFWEKTVKPPGLDGGDPVNTTTMHNNTWRTQGPRSLVTMTECTTTVAWDPVLYTDIVTILNVRTTITITFPDGTTVAFYGYLKSFEPQDFQEGEPPEAVITIVPTNYDPVSHVEAGPAVSSVAGT